MKAPNPISQVLVLAVVIAIIAIILAVFVNYGR